MITLILLLRRKLRKRRISACSLSCSGGKAFEWDEESLAWVNEEFKWEGVEVEDEEVRCDDQGQKVVQVEV
jgi:DNA polymerase III delta subunit